MTVHRLTPLPERAARGRLIVPADVATGTLSVLQRFRGPDGRHEGLVFLAGRVLGLDTMVVAAVHPGCDHSPYRVMASEAQVGRAARRARTMGLALVAQVHSHPGDDTRHSDGDDHLILMPFEGMFSLVIARYGDGAIAPEEGAGLHQFQDKRWFRIPPSEGPALVVVPSVLEVCHERA